MKKIAAMLVCVMTVGLLGGCGSNFDAAAYTKAVLDNSYKNDASGFQELKIGTPEEAAEVYEEGLDAVVDAYLSSINTSEEMEARFEEVFKNILAGAKYTVGEATKQDDGSYVVEVTYEQMNIYGPTMEIYMGQVESLSASLTEEQIADEEVLMDIIVGALCDSLAEAYENVTYAEPETTTITISVEDNVWTPKQSDLENLELNLFDSEAAMDALLGGM